MARQHRGFTLIEIMFVVMIAGLIFTAGVTPLFYTVRAVSASRETFQQEGLERAAFNRIIQDILYASSVNNNAPIRVSAEDLSFDTKDILTIWSATPSFQGRPMSSVVYGLMPKGIGLTAETPGLRRWVITKDITSENMISLLQETSSLEMIPDLEGFAVRTLAGTEWREDHIGGIPRAIKITFIYEDREKSYEMWLPNSNS